MGQHKRKIVFSLVASFVILLFNLLQGSLITISRDQCNPISLHFAIGVVAIAIFIVCLFLPKLTNNLKSVLIGVIISSFMLLLISPTIRDYQMRTTNKNLFVTYKSILNYNEQNQKLPETLDEIPNWNKLGSGFKVSVQRTTLKNIKKII